MTSIRKRNGHKLIYSFFNVESEFYSMPCEKETQLASVSLCVYLEIYCNHVKNTIGIKSTLKTHNSNVRVEINEIYFRIQSELKNTILYISIVLLYRYMFQILKFKTSVYCFIFLFLFLEEKNLEKKHWVAHVM